MFKTTQFIVMAALCLNFTNEAQSQNRPPLPKNHTITGKVISATTGEALPGAVIKITSTNQTVLSNDQGAFILSLVNGAYNLSIYYLSHKTSNISIQVPLKEPLLIALETDDKNLQEVEIVSTGFQNIPKERATGSFVQIDNRLLNRSVSTSILDRIKDVAPGIYFENNDPQLKAISRYPNQKKSGITIRGESTFNSSKEPLIILDNFPYEGEINNINPNDIESITILKDAAAASIWGARSANGVIVINTKKGSINQKLKIDFSTNVTVISKPDLFYTKNFLNAKAYIEIEQLLYDKGYFNSQLTNETSFPVVSPAVELMVKYDKATDDSQRASIKEQLDVLRSADVRQDYNRYSYQNAINQQYAIGIRGGGNNTTYAASIGHDANRNNLVKNGYSRTSVNSYNTYKPMKNLELTMGINYSRSTTNLNNNAAYGSYNAVGNPYGNIYPYARLADEHGNALPVLQGMRASYLETMKTKGFLDWNYKPLEETNLSDHTVKVTDLLIRLGATYKITVNLSAQVNYQNERQMINERNYRSAGTYYARNLINKFGAYNASTGTITFNFPKGGILDLTNTDWQQQNLKGQLNYEKAYAKHNVSMLAGAELKELTSEGYDRTAYGYDDQFGTSTGNLNYGIAYPVNPSGSAFIPAPASAIFGNVNRNVSYYIIGGYSYEDRYTLNLSARKDGANLFGVKANEKTTPLWSAGLGWDISKESFFNLDWLSSLRFRSSYGFQGNTYSGSAYLTGSYTTEPATGAASINITTAPNPSLQWEKVKNVNLALDFATKNGIITGSVEVFQKKGNNLIQPTALAPQTGFTTYQANTAALLTRGIDISLRSRILKGNTTWSTSIFISGITDKIVRYDPPRRAYNGLAVGKPLSAMFSYQWAGLNPENGNPRGYLNGKPSEDYTAIINNYSVDSLVYNGSRVPTLFGAFRNDFSYKSFSLSVNISYRFGYVFQRASTSLNYTDMINLSQHSDYNLRWTKPGDETRTNIPSVTYPANNNRNVFFQNSEILIEDGDHIRLQDIRLGYEVDSKLLKLLKVSNVNVFGYANNLGIIWRKNKLGIDPSAVSSGQLSYPASFSISFGINANF